MTESEALYQAQVIAETEGWELSEPVEVRLIEKWFRKPHWRISSKAASEQNPIGAKLILEIDDESGEVLKKGYVHSRVLAPARATTLA